MIIKKTCLNCNKPFATNLERHTLCRPCRKIVHTDICSVEELKSIKTPCLVRYKCDICGNLYQKEIRKSTIIRDKLLCDTCRRITVLNVSDDKQQLINEKRKETFIKKYGSYENYLSHRTESYENNNLKKYGVKNTTQLSIVQDKMKQTCIQKYGKPNVFAVESFKEKIKDTMNLKYGVDNYVQTIEYRKKAHKKYRYMGELFDSSWELALWIYAKDHNEPIERTPCKIKYFYNNEEHYYFPDFRYNGTLVEIKGSQFLKETGTMQNPYDHSLDGLCEAKQKCAIDNNVKFLLFNDIKFALDYVNDTYGKDYLSKFKEKQNELSENNN